MLSVVIPAYNEAQTLQKSIQDLAETLNSAGIDHELLVINDGSSDGTEQKLIELEQVHPVLRHINNEQKHGFGHAVRCGLSHYRGDAVAIVMADSSDSPLDLVAYYAEAPGGLRVRVRVAIRGRRALSKSILASS